MRVNTNQETAVTMIPNAAIGAIRRTSGRHARAKSMTASAGINVKRPCAITMNDDVSPIRPAEVHRGRATCSKASNATTMKANRLRVSDHANNEFAAIAGAIETMIATVRAVRRDIAK
ncbi:MAG: hypothetical protein EBZ40_12510 [Gammaproteobacteria bacterium]|nr:hypothetical protein [Gammaproteobacteria bacterium]